MRWPIRNQIFFPFAALLALAVFVIAVTSSILAARRYREVQNGQLARVLDTLGGADFPYTDTVLRKMRGLSGAEFVVLNDAGETMAATLPAVEDSMTDQQIPTLEGDVRKFNEYAVIELGETTYLAASIPLPQASFPGTLYVLYPRSEDSRAQWAVMWPPLAVGAGTLVLMLILSAWLAHRFGRRIASVQEMFAQLAAGRFPNKQLPDLNDELRSLLESANTLSSQLESLQNEIQRTERYRLLAQLAGGFAHQLRNAVTGARLAIELHRRECSQAASDNLRVALMQLQLTERQVQGLLTLGRPRDAVKTEVSVRTLLDRVQTLLGPQLSHRGVSFRIQSDLSDETTVLDGDALEGTLLNLALNGLEAAGSSGRVEILAENRQGNIVIEVRDDGPGLSGDFMKKAFTPFESTKPEGVGLGLTLAQHAVESLGGTIEIDRCDGWTLFRLKIPDRNSSD